MSDATVRVVLVEDNDTFRQTLELLLGMRDEIEVVGSVSNGEDAVGICRDLAPDVVLMDYRMPGLNGADATRAVLDACPTSRVVCLSASVSEREVEEVRAAGAVAVVTKDANFDRLVATVCEAGGIPA